MRNYKSFGGKSAICPIANSLPVSVSVSVSVTFVHDCRIFAKTKFFLKEITYIDLDVLHYMAQLKKNDLNFNRQGRHFETLNSRKRCEF